MGERHHDDGELAEFDQLCLRFEAGELDATATRRLDALLRSDPALRRRFHDFACLSAVLAESGSAAARGAGRRKTILFLTATAAAAALLVLALLPWGAAPRPTPRIAAMSEGLQAQITSVTGQTREAQPDQELAPDERLALVGTGSLRLIFPDGTTSLELEAGSIFSNESANGRSFRLLQGRVQASVARIESGPAFRIATPHGLSTVLGTRFILACDARHTRLQVLEGRVALEGSGRRAEIEAGFFAVASTSDELAIPSFTARSMAEDHLVEVGLEAVAEEPGVARLRIRNRGVFTAIDQLELSLDGTTSQRWSVAIAPGQEWERALALSPTAQPRLRIGFADNTTRSGPMQHRPEDDTLHWRPEDEQP